MQGGTVIQAAEVIAALALYFLPAIIADQRKRYDRLIVALFNACLGWTVIGWIIALYCAFQPNPPADWAKRVKQKRRRLILATFSQRLAERVQARDARCDHAHE